MVFSPELKDLFRDRLWPFLWKVRSIRDKRKDMIHKFLLAELCQDRPWCIHSPEVKHFIRRLEVLYDIRRIKSPRAPVALRSI